MFVPPLVETTRDLLIIVKETSKYKILNKMKLYCYLSLYKNVPLGKSPDNEITNIVRKRTKSIDKSIFKQFSPSYKKTLLRNLKHE